jgi:RecA-family ATPase
MRSGRTGLPLPDPYPNLTDMKVRFRRGGTSMIAGPPGSYKSTLALNMLTQWAGDGVTAFYVSADSDEATVAKRCAAILSGDVTEAVEKTIRKGKYTTTLNRLADVRWSFRALDIDGLALYLQAFEAVYGHVPDLVVVDNLMNCVSGPADFQGQITMTRDLDSLARDMRAHIMILHHTSEQYQGTQPPPRWNIQGKVSQFPRLILTLNCVQERLSVAVVKNTNGPQQADGGLYTDFIVDTGNCRIVPMP